MFCCGMKMLRFPVKNDVHQQRQFPGVILVFDFFPLFCSGCVLHSSTLISVCSDNEHGGHTQTAYGDGDRQTDRHGDVPDGASAFSEPPPGV